MITFRLNGEERTVDVAPDTPLLVGYSRRTRSLTGTKFGCGMALCGACTVHIDGYPSRSCSMPIGDLAGADDGHDRRACPARRPTAVQTAWETLDVVQCGYCQSGQIMSAVSLLVGYAQADR